MSEPTRTPSTGLGDILAQLGWRPEHLAERLNAFAAEQGRVERIHSKTPYKWLRGGQPRSPWPTLTTVVLSETLRRSVTNAELGWPDEDLECVPASSGLWLPWTPDGSLQAARTVTEAVTMHRRTFLTLLGTAITAPAHEWLIAQAVASAARPDGYQLTEEVLDQLDAITDGLRRLDDQLGGGAVLDLVREHLRTVTDFLEQRRYTDTVGRRLHATAAELLRLAGWLSFDASHHAQAQRYWIAALHAAHSAGDQGLGANILGFMSCQAKDLGQIREAVTLAETARAGYPTTASRVGAILDLRAAEAHANDGSITSTRRAIDSAFDHLTATAPSHGDPAWSYWLNEAHAHGQAGYCYIQLQDWARARSHLRSALKLQGADSAREGALRQILLATTYARQHHPDLDRAVHLGSQAVETLAGDVDSARCIGHVGRLVTHLAPHRRNNPAIQQLADQARQLLTTAA
jgi:tetratricopeptide (TPR) repeat protein